MHTTFQTEEYRSALVPELGSVQLQDLVWPLVVGSHILSVTSPHLEIHIAFRPHTAGNGELSALFLISSTNLAPQGETMTSGLLMNQASFGTVDSIWEALPRPARYYREIYEQNRHHIYSLCFWMTGSELEAEELTHNVFHRTFRNIGAADAAVLDAAVVSELRDSRPIGNLTLQCGAVDEVLNVRLSARLDDLEQAVLQLPATERMIYLLHDGEGYDGERVGALIGLSGDDVRAGLHQARLRIRELLAS